MDKDIVARVAKAAHIRLTDEELEKYSKDLGDILEYFAILDEAPNHEGNGINPVEVADVLRDDVPEEKFESEKLLADMKTYENYIRGPKLV
ncbi:MAG: aspartyl/glutamyl-tRNA amidotransferase subunit C [Methanomethylophilus sp.]|jgi:aspartyl-tRNA(Asn)/glutamyl-tRNA(Gln) amidotransferase subunit C|nr:Asp-tRNA(Asn)/Glu-tRNA(Gln) amidotransferase subunit C GatC [methanogenic archaeon ISO4-H5]MBO5519537.1 Asp-tRNA(Asn)/Glu-tRNA(Gln) amidotransferase GatCAB subunit C [Methanomethylophilus sp.]MEE3363828.1 aspartyl/glutamyl-tRNA amidotransferase subunit C [Methanomethylophilus sp.]MEE3478139.1 aspartyl/glutamyl-tRNA amidotransferase subunit C [Methanomethylophilus sp.]